MHLGLLDCATAFAVIAVRAGSYQVRPFMFAPQMARNHVVDGQVSHMLAAVLAGIVIAPSNLSL